MMKKKKRNREKLTVSNWPSLENDKENLFFSGFLSLFFNNNNICDNINNNNNNNNNTCRNSLDVDKISCLYLHLYFLQLLIKCGSYMHINVSNSEHFVFFR